MPTGTVKWFNDQKGYGFIEPADGSREVFVHQTDIQMAGWRTLEPGLEVVYELVSTERGPRAKNVRAPGVAVSETQAEAEAEPEPEAVSEVQSETEADAA